MNKKLLSILTDKCKTAMGLSVKAIEFLATTGSEGLTDESSDEDIQAAANRMLPLAQQMQAEGTRWAQNSKPKNPKNTEGDGGDGDGDKSRPAWFEEYRQENDQKIQKLQDENDRLKVEKTKNERASQISAKAKELGIPDYLMKRFSIADDADFDKELTEYKQDLVTNKLMPETSGGDQSSIEEAHSGIADSILDEIEVKKS